ncbi:MAG: S8 family serine peptidase [Myxococcota bacterium]
MLYLARGLAAVLSCALLLAAALPARAQVGAERVVVKLRDGSDATLERGELIARRSDLAPLFRALAERGVGRGRFSRTFSRSPETLRAERSRAERRSGRRLADLALYFTIEVPAGTDPASLAAALRRLSIVESAAPWPKPAPPPVDIDPPTPDFTALQTYTAAAPAGIRSAGFASVSGADGAGTRYVDIEFWWQLGHEDLELPASALIPIGTPFNPFMDYGSHGSAVLGILSARANGYGTTGLVPAAEVFAAPAYTVELGWDVGLAIEQALVTLDPSGPGDLILIEQQAYICGYDGSGGTQLGAGPIEGTPGFEAWRDAIEVAVALGVTVVEAAGNGSLDLDSPSCEGIFDRALNGDSGAIFVAAGAASTHAPLAYSNHGSRIDVQGIAEGVATLGGGALFGGSDVLQRYQSDFGGSSSAAAMVAGLVLSLQGMRIAQGLAPLEPLELRALLVETGTPQAPDPRQIGPLPDLAAAYAVAVPPTPVSTLPLAGKLALGALLLGVIVVRARRS